MNIGEKIQTLLSNNEMTQKDLAEKMSVQPTTVQKWCAGINTPDVYTVKELCHIFCIPIQDFLDNDYDIIKYYTLDRYPVYSAWQDSEHTVIDADLASGARLHRFTNQVGAACSAIYIGSSEQWWHYREMEPQMIRDWNQMHNK